VKIEVNLNKKGIKMREFKNSLISFIIFIAFVISSYSATVKTVFDEIKVFAEEIDFGNSSVSGDLNNDTEIDVFDLMIFKNKFLNKKNFNMENSDLNFDGVVNLKDLNEFQDYMLTKINKFSVDVKKSLKSIDRSIVTKNINNQNITGVETQLTFEMAEIAKKLNSPIEIYKYVLNNVETEFYYGSRKGAIATYEQNGGNDFDQASLLISMLRYMGYTANYAIAEIIINDNDLYNITATSNIDAAKRIFTSQGRTIESDGLGNYKTERVMVSLEVDGKLYPLDPSFKYYKLNEYNTDIKSEIEDFELNYNLTNEKTSLKNISQIIENNLNEKDITSLSSKYKIVDQNLMELPLSLPYKISSENVMIYKAVPENKADIINLFIDDFQVFAYRSAYLYNKNLTIEYELIVDEEYQELFGGKSYFSDTFGINNIMELTKNLGANKNLAQIYAVVKIDGKKIANGKSNLLGSKEDMRINVKSANSVFDFKKELTYGGLYSVVFDYQMISPHDIAANYSKLPKNIDEQSKINQSNIFGSAWLMDTLTLIGKSYFSQIDTQNEIISEISDIYYERFISVAVVDFTPDIYSNLNENKLNKQGKIGIDVIGNQTNFISRENNNQNESKTRHSTGFLSSFYESEVIKQFTGLQAVSTAEVLNYSYEKGINILYISSANISELNNSKLSEKNKTDIIELVNKGNYVTVPNEEITISDWKGTGYIVYNPTTDLNEYIINTNLYGGQLCSWVGISFLSDVLVSVVECSWAFELIMLGATILGAGLILLSGPVGIALLGITIGLGLIVGGGFYLKNIGDRLYESTELMGAYIDGDMIAGEKLKTKTAWHVGFVAVGHFGGKLLAKPISSLANKIHLEEKVGRLVSNAFSNTPGGYTQAVDILNSISPKYTELLTYLINKHGSSVANDITKIDDASGTKGVEKAIDVYTSLDDIATKYSDDIMHYDTP